MLTSMIFEVYTLFVIKSEVSFLKVDIKIQKEIKEPYAVVYTDKLSEEINEVVQILNSNNTKSVLPANARDKIVILKLHDIFMVRIENKQVVVYCEKTKYTVNKRLYELEKILGKGFMRISKSTIINLKKVSYVEPSFNGMMQIFLLNGCNEYISRKYLLQFKKYLGI